MTRLTRITAVNSTVTAPLNGMDIMHTVQIWDGWHPSIGRMLYGHNHIRVPFPALHKIGLVAL